MSTAIDNDDDDQMLHDTYAEYEEWFALMGYPEDKKATKEQWTAFRDFLFSTPELEDLNELIDIDTEYSTRH